MEKLQTRGSPREIVKRLARAYSGEKTMRISHETLDRSISMLPRGALKTTLIQALRQARAYRSTRQSQDHEEPRGKRVAMLAIEERPHEVADRTLPGHGAGRSHLG
jgi:IS30 family transposase